MAQRRVVVRVHCGLHFPNNTSDHRSIIVSLGKMRANAIVEQCLCPDFITTT